MPFLIDQMALAGLPFSEWGAGEYGRLARGVLKGKPRAEAVGETVAEFQSVFGGRLVLPVNRGRTALRIALEVFHQERPDRNEVLVPSYICPAVPEAVVAAGLI